jgi:hypothetical protein
MLARADELKVRRQPETDAVDQDLSDTMKSHVADRGARVKILNRSRPAVARAEHPNPRYFRIADQPPRMLSMGAWPEGNS